MLRFSSLIFIGLALCTLSGLAGSMGYPDTYATKMTVQEIELYNTTLLNEKILAKLVVCRTRWGTPMLPDGKGGYSEIMHVNPVFVKESNIIPPLTDGPVYRPNAKPVATEKIVITPVVPVVALPAK